MTQAEKEKYRRIRGAILKLLAYEHPRPIDHKVLYSLLDNLGMTIDEEEYDSHLAYLAEKNMVRTETRGLDRIKIRFITITAHGLDVLDKFDSECGVDVNF